MASSQVEIVSSSPFGCVLRDHNRKERCRESNVRAVQAVFEKNLKDLVRDHIHGCISFSSHENSQNQLSRVASWVTNEQVNGNPHSLRLSNKNNIKNEEPSAITPRQSPVVLDRWVTRQAQDVTASTMQKHVHEAEPLLAPSNSNTAFLTTSMASSTKTRNAQNSSSQLENASVSQNRGASSLVQIWEARLNRSNSTISNMGSNTSRASSGSSSNEKNGSLVTMEEPSTGDPFDEKSNDGTNNEDWESQSDRTAPGEPPSSSCSRSCDDGERERLRVADIIKRLSISSEDANDHEHSTNVTDTQTRERRHASTSYQAEQRCFTQVVNSPRLRGRQAFNDLLMLMEGDRSRELDSLVERQAVSRFSQRGRLQSMLRLRCLQRSVTIQDKCRPQSLAAQVNRSPQGSTIKHLREKFSTGAENPMPAQNDSATPRCLSRELSNKSIQLEKSCTSKPQSEDTHCQKVSMNTNEDLHEQTKPTSDAVPRKTSLEARCIKLQETTEATTSLEHQPDKHPFPDSQGIADRISSENKVAEYEDNHSQHLCLDLQETIETTSLHSCTEDEIAEAEEIAEQEQEIAESATSYNDPDKKMVTEELEDHYEEYFGQTNYNWFSNISRPRSYWEGLRKAWYQEVLNTTSKDEEIRQLLERGRVSSFLASDFRERMDRLMISRVQMQADQAESQEDKVDDEDKMVQVMSYLRRHSHPSGGQGEEQEGRGGVQEVDRQKKDDDEESSLISHQYHEVNSYFNQSTSSIQMPSPSLITAWSFQDDSEIGNGSERAPSTSSPPPTSSQRQRSSSSSINRHSLEMELIYDLRGHIEQLHQEMAELRKLIMSCIDMQMKLQQSIIREVHSDGGEGKNSEDRAPWKRSCCICYEEQVDSLLYRCGHMCTCLKCAHELQWNGGNCPICRAPILDIVAYQPSERVLAPERGPSAFVINT